MIQLIYARYYDVGVPRPRYGGDLFTCRRQVINIRTVPGGETGTIQYQGHQVAVYRRPGGHWQTDPAALAPPKISYRYS